MSRRPRRNQQSPAFKAKVAIEASADGKTIRLEHGGQPAARIAQGAGIHRPARAGVDFRANGRRTCLRARSRQERGRPFKMTAAKLCLAMASMGQPEAKVGDLCEELGVTRQKLYRHVSPKGELRPDGVKLLARV